MEGKAICGYGNTVVIYEIEDGIFAFVNTKNETVRFNNYWLNVAKYEPVSDVSLLDDELINKADGILENEDVSVEELREFFKTSVGQRNEVIDDDQTALLKQSRDKKKAIYLT